MTEPAIETTQLSKVYGDTVALDEVNLQVDPGVIYGYLGPNGAGKSTTIGILIDYIRATRGAGTIFGNDVHEDSVELHERLGFLPDQYSLYDRNTARQHLELIADIHRTEVEPGTLLQRVGLGDEIETKVGEFSQGMKQRLALAMAIVGEPDLLILDEPFTGLDPHGVRTVRDIITEENDTGTTVFFSSHLLEQVDRMCDRVGILSDGELLAEGPPDELRAGAGLEDDASVESLYVEYTTSEAAGRDCGGGVGE